MKTLRASEVGTYLYCARAWWYSQQGLASSNQAEMTAGTGLHLAHGRQVQTSILLRLLGLLLLLLALALIAIFLTVSLRGGRSLPDVAISSYTVSLRAIVL